MLERGMSFLKEKFGAIDILECKISFHSTDYYYPEMGQPLWRCFFGFSNLIPREMLIDAKLFTNKIENTLAKEDGRRTLNIDPGYLTGAQFILATGKNFARRIYLGKGIFGDLTLTYAKGEWIPNYWTYPDYKTEPILGLLNKIREIYLNEIKT